jgi:hypothetical protein
VQPANRIKKPLKDRIRAVALDPDTDQKVMVGKKLEGSISKFLRKAIDLYWETEIEGKK